MPNWRRHHVQFGLAILLGFALRLLFVLHAPRIAGDTLMYGDIAKNWMHHWVYGFADSPTGPVPTLIRLPGYPLFLAVCFRIFGDDQYNAVMLIQTLIDLGTCVLLWDLTRRLFGGRAAMVALWMAALCPFTANYVSAPLTETLTLATIAAAFYGLERWCEDGGGWNRWMWAIAGALTYSLLLRPEQGLLAAAVVPAMLWVVFKKTEGGISATAPVAAVALCMILPLVPWSLRNWHTFHVFEPLVPRDAVDPGELVPVGFNRWYRTWAIDFASTEDVYWNWNTSTIDIDDLPTRAFDTDEQYDRVNDLLNEYNQTSNATPKLESAFAALAKERIEDDPVRYYLALPLARLVNMMLRPRVEMMEIDLEWWRWRKHRAQTAFATAYAALDVVYLAAAAVGLWRWRRRKWDGYGVLAWSTAGFFLLRCGLLLTLDNSEPRYTLEFFPLLILWTAALFISEEKRQARRLS
ncbi:glycosyltransferase family 39 protein [Edaphobacter sp. 12200R-103]|uniref:ArnT family glycosyltransferase n=1 Tax=Edaphobacter sp. 12200R-103 TaxID=2703788 RepID=UPI00138C2BD6|nr:glycosyltransferase family 39 protein [Edaphobacter sp. 12200R-103]QHS50808.1 glycosyltransferase family 39 protein [Edaphobacter sp. 12200R-103]